MWRNTTNPVRLLVVDARVLLPMFICLLHIRWSTFIMAGAGVVLFTVLEWIGLPPGAAFRLVRRWIAGRIRPAVPTWKRRRFA